MMVLKNSVFAASIFLFANCDKGFSGRNSQEGFLGSKAYREYIGWYKNDSLNFDFSNKRMFMLLNEESFLYSSDYDYYAIFTVFYKTRDTVDFYILKSKDDINSLTRKRLYNPRSFFYFEKSEKQKSDSAIFDFSVKAKVLEMKKSDSLLALFNDGVSLLESDETYAPLSHAEIRAFYFFDGRDYYLANESNLNPATMNKIDSFLRKTELFGTE